MRPFLTLLKIVPMDERQRGGEGDWFLKTKDSLSTCRCTVLSGDKNRKKLKEYLISSNLLRLHLKRFSPLKQNLMKTPEKLRLYSEGLKNDEKKGYIEKVKDMGRVWRHLQTGPKCGSITTLA